MPTSALPTHQGHRPSSDRRAGVAIAATVAALVAVLSLSTAVPASAVAAERDAAFAWLSAEITAGDGTLPAPTGGGVDWGLTADAALSYAVAGRGGDAAAVAATDAALDAVGPATTWDDIPGDLGGVRLAGPTAKLALLAATQGRSLTDPAAAGGVALEPELRSLIVASGEQAGRVADRNPHAPDNSNTFGQAYAILALSHTAEGTPDAVVDFLLAQQCPAGGVRLFVTGGPSCTDDTQADADATALALQALGTVERTDRVTTTLSTAAGWLLGRQLPDGSFGGDGPTAAPNANTTALAAQALRSLGQSEAAERAAAWITGLALTPDAVAGTPAAGDVGAVAYRPQARTAALANGIAPGARDQWRRATSQAVLALGTPAFGVPVDAAPVTPSSLPTTTAVPTTPPPTTAELPPTQPPVPAAPAPPAGVQGATATPGATGATGAQRLALTGTRQEMLLGVALVLLGGGAVLLGSRGLTLARGEG